MKVYIVVFVEKEGEPAAFTEIVSIHKTKVGAKNKIKEFNSYVDKGTVDDFCDKYSLYSPDLMYEDIEYFEREVEA